MATDSFKFWDSYYSALQMLGTDERRGRFVMALCAYVFDGVEPAFADDVMAFGFELVATQARESKEISARAREKGRIGGKRSAQVRGALSTASRGASSEKKGEERKGTELSSPTPNPTTAPGGVLAPPPAPDGPPLP